MKKNKTSRAWVHDHLNDPYVQRAQADGYRARAAYKLLEIDERDHLLKPGAVVVDAGYNRVEGRDKDVGDCHFAECSAVAGWITPVPGGVGPMTVVSLLMNTVDAAEAQFGKS